jgi:anti-sigma factor RsiW
MSPQPPHVEVAAYALGLLDQEDHEAFELHLLDCAECRAELQDLVEMPDLLDEVKAARAATERRIR